MKLTLSFQDLTPNRQKQILQKRAEMLQGGLYGTRQTQTLDEWLSEDRDWVTVLEWTTSTEALDEIQDMFTDEEGIVWEAVEDYLASGMDDRAYQAYADPGDPRERTVVINLACQNKPKLILLQGGRCD